MIISIILNNKTGIIQTDKQHRIDIYTVKIEVHSLDSPLFFIVYTLFDMFGFIRKPIFFPSDTDMETHSSGCEGTREQDVNVMFNIPCCFSLWIACVVCCGFTVENYFFYFSLIVYK